MDYYYATAPPEVVRGRKKPTKFWHRKSWLKFSFYYRCDIKCDVKTDNISIHFSPKFIKTKNVFSSTCFSRTIKKPPQILSFEALYRLMKYNNNNNGGGNVVWCHFPSATEVWKSQEPIGIRTWDRRQCIISEPWGRDIVGFALILNTACMKERTFPTGAVQLREISAKTKTSCVHRSRCRNGPMTYWPAAVPRCP